MKKLKIMLFVSFLVVMFFGIKTNTFADNTTEWTSWGSGNSLPTENGNYKLTTNVVIDNPDNDWYVEGKEINIDLNNYKISRTDVNNYSMSIRNGSIINLFNGEIDLPIYIGGDSTLSLKKITYNQQVDLQKGNNILKLSGCIIKNIVDGRYGKTYITGPNTLKSGFSFNYNENVPDADGSIIIQPREGYALKIGNTLYKTETDITHSEFVDITDDEGILTYNELIITEVAKHTINKSANNGVINVIENEVAGEEVSFTVKANEGYQLDKVEVKDLKGNNIAVENNKFTMPDSNVTITATFKKVDDKTTTNSNDNKEDENNVETPKTFDPITMYTVIASSALIGFVASKKKTKKIRRRG